ncbi:MAG: hypothetical protein ACXVGF_04820 [Blastococcus sp.]
MPPRVRLDVSASAGETSTTVTRQDPNGSVVPVRTQDGGPVPISGGSALIYDYEVPYSAAVTYSTQESPSTVSGSVTLAVSSVWLVHPGVPALSMPVTLRPGTLQEETYAVARSVLFPMGRANPIIVTDGTRKGGQSSLTLMTQNLNDIAAIKALFADAGTLLLNIPADQGIGFGTCYIAAGDVKLSRWTDVVIDAYRDVTLSFYVVDRPAGGTTAQRTMADLTVYPTLADVNAHYATLGAVLAGP